MVLMETPNFQRQDSLLDDTSTLAYLIWLGYNWWMPSGSLTRAEISLTPSCFSNLTCMFQHGLVRSKSVSFPVALK